MVLDTDRNANVRVRLGDPNADIQCADITDISISKGLIWHTVQFKALGQTHKLAGLSRRSANALAADLYTFINSYLFGVIDGERPALSAANTGLPRDQYLAVSDLNRALSDLPKNIASALRHPLFDSQLMPDAFRASLPQWLKMAITPALRHDHNEAFVSAEHSALKNFFDDLDGRSLSHQQREACIRLEDNNLLVASAGSGKSATIVGKLAYVLEKKLYEPKDILLLAFNKSAADELKGRIAKQLGVNEAALECRVTTFHALGRSIIQDVSGRPPKLANWAGHPAGEAKAIQDIIQTLFDSDPEFAALWTELLVVHPKADMPVEHFDRQADYDRYTSARRRNGNATIGALSGDFVKSLQEQKIANWLWLNSVDFEYEKQIEVDDRNSSPSFVHPDFYYPQTDSIHEHFALNADGSSPFANYAEHARAKRQTYAQMGRDFFETTSAQATDGSLIDTLRSALVERGYGLQARDWSEIKKAIEPVVIDHCNKIISTSVKHVRARQLTLEALLERAETLHDKARGRVFARVVSAIAQAYSRKLAETEEIDFDSMIGDATRLIETGRYQSPFSLILVDEFQDISEPNANLIKALRSQRSSCKIFAVGDDWQSIYRFAGSDISLFTRFEDHFGQGWVGRLEQTYRCNQLIAETAAKFVQRNPAQLKKEVRSSRSAIPRSIRVVPVGDKESRPDFNQACQAVLERLDAALGGIAEQWRQDPSAKLKVLVLWRYNRLDPFEGRAPRFENINVTGMSFHRAKGLEADYVVLLDISEGDYGVPSQIEDDELLNLVIPRPETFAYAEERRLFYVALTRAIRGVYLLTHNRQPSRYVQELCQIAGDDVMFETAEGLAVEDQCPDCKVGRIVPKRSRSGSSFKACNQFPSCRYNESNETRVDHQRRRAR
ncbi:UvrD-helicase domain-containing protein [Pelagibacterium luteolum]|uniref:UvrD-helicase domain-containing protein n=1 Tax=Pelagibacterium luteolum TaxID=440168 RepID=UPI001FCCC9DF|nr:UvrD-helicase domain-containing protein [Pelagibacterium luteolum]